MDARHDRGQCSSGQMLKEAWRHKQDGKRWQVRPHEALFKPAAAGLRLRD
jgi:hypothetical protein